MLRSLPWETKERVMPFTANGKDGATWGGAMSGCVRFEVLKTIRERCPEGSWSSQSLQNGSPALGNIGVLATD